ncbi:PmeII family type II restriction endonuclease [Rhizobium leguminosarum]|uniref:PmeII family type II restriction endonuclease n=1 Tax=Rhizobium leguminosarum TaxID=384 RepID=UPI003F982134
MSQLNDEVFVEGEAPLPLAEALRPRRFKRAELAEALPAGAIEQFIDETYQFLNRRFQTLAVDFNDIAKTNFNPFLLLITAPVYNTYSPFEVAERLQFAKAFHGDDTAFGRMAEERFLKVLGANPPLEKKVPEKKTRWSPIDLEATIDGQRYLMSIKAGPWTMNQSHANEMVQHFQALREETNAKIIIGITYGRYKNLNNKPVLVQNGLGNPDWFDYLVGKDFWEFVSGVKDVHKDIFKAIRIAQKQFAAEHSDETFNELLIANRLKIASSLRKQFRVTADDDFWGTLFNSMFESEAGLPGHEDEVAPLAVAPVEVIGD